MNGIAILIFASVFVFIVYLYGKKTQSRELTTHRHYDMYDWNKVSKRKWLESSPRDTTNGRG